jgi:rRNA-processing protein FCF1
MMGLDKEDILSGVSFESLFDEHSATIDRELFKDEVAVKVKSSGKNIEIDRSGRTGDDLIIKVLDPHQSMMYNVFSNDSDYKKWMHQSLHEPSEQEVMNSMRENG